MKTWVITGVGRGLGKALAEKVLESGDKVLGTVRTELDRQRFENLHRDRAEGLILDLSDPENAQSILQQRVEQAQGVDILVNNAGYGLYGAIEEVSLSELRANFEVNFFGSFACIKAVLPHLRAKQSGHIINITSVSGLAPWAGAAPYGATKYALECLGQTLALEMAPFGVNVTNVEPGGIETDFASKSLSVANQFVSAYRETPAHLPRQFKDDDSKTMPSDAAKVAEAIVQIAEMQDPPVHLLLGADAVHYAGQQVTRIITDMTDNMPLTMRVSRVKNRQG